jgi:hypothetical protein
MNKPKLISKFYAGGKPENPESSINVDDLAIERENANNLKKKWLSGSNLSLGQIVYDNLSDGWTPEQISAVMGNSHLETGGWNQLKQIKGPARGLFMMEPAARKEYGRWLLQNNLQDTQDNEVNYIQHLMDNKLLSTPWSNLDKALPYINKQRLSKGLSTFATVEELQDYINSIPDVETAQKQGLRCHWQHRGYTTEQAYDDWENGDVEAKTRAFGALYEKPGIPHWDRRYGAAQAILHNLQLFNPNHIVKVNPLGLEQPNIEFKPKMKYFGLAPTSSPKPENKQLIKRRNRK